VRRSNAAHNQSQPAKGVRIMQQATVAKRVAIYARVSTTDQTTDNQLRELRAVAERAGWQIVAEFVDHGISGAKGRDKRPQFDAMLKAATRREFDLLATWSIDRLGRSLQHLIGALNELHAVGVDLYMHQQQLDTTTPAGRVIFSVMGAFAEFERNIIVERVRAGMARAKAQGKRLGRRPLDPDKRRAVLASLSAGRGVRETARAIKVSPAMVSKLLKQETAKAA